MWRPMGHPRVMGTLEVEDRPVSWVRTGTMKGRPLFVFAHGAGAPMTHPFMDHVAHGLVDRGTCVLRFHFPYMELAQTSGKRRAPDPAKRLLATWRAMLDLVKKMRGSGPVVIGGKSMGGRMASLLAAAGDAPEACGLVYLGYPLHPAGKPEKLRAEHLSEVPAPQLFVQGSKDKLCDPKKLRRILKKIPDARVVLVKGGGHSLARSRKRPFEGSDAWLDEVAEFIRDVT